MAAYQKPRTGLSLVELLVVASIIAALAGLAASAVQRVRATAIRASCGNNLRQIGLAVHAYTDANDGAFPPGRIGDNGGITWAAMLFPHLGEPARFDPKTVYYSQPLELRLRLPKAYQCPARPSKVAGEIPDSFPWPFYPVPRDGPSGWNGAVGDYAACDGNGGGAQTTDANGIIITASFTQLPQPTRIISWSPSTRLSSVTDGLSNTLLVGERHAATGEMGNGPLYNGDKVGVNSARLAGHGRGFARPGIPWRWAFGSEHETVGFVMGDGSVRWLSYDMDNRTLTGLAARDDGR